MPSSSGAADVTPARGIFGMPSDEELEADIQLIRTRLCEYGLETASFGIGDVWRAGFTTKQFFKHIRVFMSVEDDDYRGQLLTAALRANILNSIKKITLREFIALCKWLKSDAGQSTIRAVSRSLGLQKRFPAAENLKIAALAQAFEFMLSDYQIEVKSIRQQMDYELEELRRQIRITERECQVKIAEVVEENRSAADFKGFKI